MTWLVTATNTVFDLANPDPATVNVSDIAHALNGICRFSGHTSEHYSVLQHSLLVSSLCPPELRLEGLLHDALEAYIGDITSPVKQFIKGLKELEERVESTIFTALDVKRSHDPRIKQADLIALELEAEYFFGRSFGNVDDINMTGENRRKFYTILQMRSMTAEQRIEWFLKTLSSLGVNHA